MTLTERINEDIKEAMKSGQKDRLLALRDIKSKLLLEMTREGGDGVVDENVGLAILKKLLKQRQESAEIYKTQGREDLFQEEERQADTIRGYLPEALSPEALESSIREIISQVGASSLTDLGKVMGVASKKLAGLADGKAISELVRKLLS